MRRTVAVVPGNVRCAFGSRHSGNEQVSSPMTAMCRDRELELWPRAAATAALQSAAKRHQGGWSFARCCLDVHRFPNCEAAAPSFLQFITRTRQAHLVILSGMSMCRCSHLSDAQIFHGFGCWNSRGRVLPWSGGQLVLGANLFLACEIVSSTLDDTVDWDGYQRPMLLHGPTTLTTGAAQHQRVGSSLGTREVVQAAQERRAVPSDRLLGVPMESSLFAPSHLALGRVATTSSIREKESPSPDKRQQGQVPFQPFSRAPRSRCRRRRSFRLRASRTHAVLDGHRLVQLEADLRLRAWLDHTGFGVDANDTGHIGRAEEELRLVAGAERGVATTFVLAEDEDLCAPRPVRCAMVTMTRRSKFRIDTLLQPRDVPQARLVQDGAF
jgi:hypothetical protein